VFELGLRCGSESEQEKPKRETDTANFSVGMPTEHVGKFRVTSARILRSTSVKGQK